MNFKFFLTLHQENHAFQPKIAGKRLVCLFFWKKAKKRKVSLS